MHTFFLMDNEGSEDNDFSDDEENFTEHYQLDSPLRSNIELKEIFNLTSNTLISVSRNICLEPALCQYVYWLDEVSRHFQLGSSSFFRGLTLFHQMLYVNQTQYKLFALEHYLSACFLLAIYIEDDWDINHPMYKAQLAQNTKITTDVLEECMRHVLVSLKNDLYHVEDIYDCYVKNLYKDHSLYEHELFITYLTLIRCNYRFTQFSNKTVLSALNQCLFNKGSALESYASSVDIQAFNECKKMVAWLVYCLPISISLQKNEDSHVSLKKRGVSVEQIHAYLLKPLPAVQGASLKDVLLDDFVTRLQGKDECAYQLLSGCPNTFFSNEVKGALNTDSIFQNFVLSWFDKLSIHEARNKLMTLDSHIITSQCEAAYRHSLLFRASSSHCSPSTDSLTFSDLEDEKKDEDWQKVPFMSCPRK